MSSKEFYLNEDGIFRDKQGRTQEEAYADVIKLNNFLTSQLKLDSIQLSTTLLVNKRINNLEESMKDNYKGHFYGNISFLIIALWLIVLSLNTIWKKKEN